MAIENSQQGLLHTNQISDQIGNLINHFALCCGMKLQKESQYYTPIYIIVGVHYGLGFWGFIQQHAINWFTN